MMAIRRPGPDDCSPYLHRYVGLVPGGEILDILARQIQTTLELLRSVPGDRETHRYAPGKWSIREVVGHLMDTERVFVYRALRFSRRDETPLPGFDQDDYVRAGGFDRRPLLGLLEEFASVRDATVSLFGGLDAEAWERAGTAADARVLVRAYPYVIAGHELHHRSILEERYL